MLEPMRHSPTPPRPNGCARCGTDSPITVGRFDRWRTRCKTAIQETPTRQFCGRCQRTADAIASPDGKPRRSRREGPENQVLSRTLVRSTRAVLGSSRSLHLLPSNSLQASCSREDSVSVSFRVKAEPPNRSTTGITLGEYRFSDSDQSQE